MVDNGTELELLPAAVEFEANRAGDHDLKDDIVFIYQGPESNFLVGT